MKALSTQHSALSTQLNSIQLLRAIAALGVVYTHCVSEGGLNIKNTGGWGVDIFFIISGFIMAYIVLGNTDHFFVKRLFRIVPLYFIATFLVIFVAIIFPQLVHSTVLTFSKAIKSLFFIPYEDKLKLNYPILGQGWTLRFEMVFYIAMALSIVIMKNKKYISIVCSSILVLFIVILNIFNPNIFILSYYHTQGVFLEFIYGLALYYIYYYLDAKINKIIKYKIVFSIFFAIISIMSIMYLILSDVIWIRFFDNRSIYYGIPAFILVLSFLLLEKQINKKNTIIKFGLLLGEASYAMYLFHYHIIAFISRIIFPRIGNNNSFIIELLKLTFTIIIIIIISIYLYKFIDKPIQKKLRNILKK
ncbi:exopolysaccharide production protein ExoZ [Spirochaetia bacterium]|nr:exopolysaccharide production protein ExoZ [Spirochaetia bacterium]